MSGSYTIHEWVVNERQRETDRNNVDNEDNKGNCIASHCRYSKGTENEGFEFNVRTAHSQLLAVFYHRGQLGNNCMLASYPLYIYMILPTGQFHMVIDIA